MFCVICTPFAFGSIGAGATLPFRGVKLKNMSPKRNELEGTVALRVGNVRVIDRMFTVEYWNIPGGISNGFASGSKSMT